MNSSQQPGLISQSPRLRISLYFLLVAATCLLIADISVTSINPMLEMQRFFAAWLKPDTDIIGIAAEALLITAAFALLGVALAAIGGLLIATQFQHRWLRMLCAGLRSVHEIFWALIFLQCFGLHPLTGLLAIALPYSGVFAKVYAEILEDVSPGPSRVIATNNSRITNLCYSQIAQAWPHLVSYTRYRFECGIRSSAILGFIGLPTLGYYLEASFSQGYYSEVASLLLLFFVLIATIRIWCHKRLMPIWLLSSPWLILSDYFNPAGQANIQWQNIERFFTSDIIPAPLRHAASFWEYDSFIALFQWCEKILTGQILPGLWNTLILTQIALVATGILALLLFPLASKLFVNNTGRSGGKLLLIIARSTPEYLLAYMLLQLWGPSMLPAIVALALHNGALIAHLLAKRSEHMPLRKDTPSGVNRYGYEVLPRLYNPFMAILFYRWEVIMRETAILGILGIHTLGFFVDSAIQEIRFDVALLLIISAALLNILVDYLAGRLRKKLRLQQMSSC